MVRFSIVVGLALASSSAFAQVKTPDWLAQFDCQAGSTCTLKCWGAGGDILTTYRSLVVYQYKEHPTRMWYLADTKRYVAAIDQTCSFEGQMQGAMIPPTPLNRPDRPGTVIITPPNR
jgi:hypothetical protein